MMTRSIPDIQSNLFKNFRLTLGVPFSVSIGNIYYIGFVPCAYTI